MLSKLCWPIVTLFSFILSDAVTAQTLSGDRALLGAGTYPRTTRLADGTLLGAYTAFNGGNTTLTTVTSSDDGASWSPLGSVAQANTTLRDLDNPFPLQLSSGRALLAYRNHERTDSTTYTYYRITISCSDDNGATWTYLSTPAERAATSTKNGIWEPFMRLALDGSLQLYYSSENADDDQDSLLIRSTDGGATWTSPQTISGSDVTARDGMLGVATVPGAGDGALIAVFESVAPGGTFSVHRVNSSDDGTTWGNRATVYEPSGYNAGAPQVVTVGSNLAVSFMTDEDSSTSGTGIWPDNAEIKVVTSADEGVSWGSAVVVNGAVSHWAGEWDLDDNSWLVLYANDDSVWAQKMTL